MAYDEILANRVREILSPLRKVEEKKMMGGLTFMVNDKMCVGILKDNLMVRIDPDIYEEVLERRGCREMDFTGRPMRGFVFVDPEGTNTKKDLNNWLGLALEYNKKARPSK
jgi:TfoX/Sxy family transcriptional regulator of competence genes